MKTLYFESTPRRPSIYFDNSIGRLMITGNSVMCDVDEVYGDLLTNINEYVKNPQEETQVSILVREMNSGSTLYLFEILKALDTIGEKGNVSVSWMCDAYDESMVEKIEIIQEALAMQINTIPYLESSRPLLADYCVPA